ncbi:MAG TPA: hypothetical protein VEU74_02990 [Gemmatimonadales bacterium]|nr:hypothetical protein [Gemmatimonadales bacterium]
MTAVIGDQCYSTETASLLAHDASWDGRHWDRDGRNILLFRTPNGQYFRQVRTRWARERDYLEPLTLEAAIRLFWKLPERALRFEEAFPRVTPLDGVTNIDLARIVTRLRGAQRLRLERELPGCEWLSAQLASSSLDLDEFHAHLATCGICRAILKYLAGTADMPLSADE